MKKSMLLMEVCKCKDDCTVELYRRRIADNFDNIEQWLQAKIVGCCRQLYGHNCHIELNLDDYGCGEVICHYSENEHKVLYTIKTTNIGVI